MGSSRDPTLFNAVRGLPRQFKPLGEGRAAGNPGPSQVEFKYKVESQVEEKDLPERVGRVAEVVRRQVYIRKEVVSDILIYG